MYSHCPCLVRSSAPTELAPSCYGAHLCPRDFGTLSVLCPHPGCSTVLVLDSGKAFKMCQAPRTHPPLGSILDCLPARHYSDGQLQFLQFPLNCPLLGAARL